MSQQNQFLDVIDRDEAERRFRAALRLEPLGEDSVAIQEALGRVLARDVTSRVDVPSFDRSNFDGFAVRAQDTFGADEEQPRRLRLLAERVATAVVPTTEVTPGSGVVIVTGGMLPRGSDAVVMMEHADVEGDELLIHRPVTPGSGVSYAGTDLTAGEIVLRQGMVLTSRETGVLAAIGIERVRVWKQPRVAVISTGDEIIEPGQPMRPGLVYDSNSRILADAVRELGGLPRPLGIVRDNLDALREILHRALSDCDAVLLSGGTSKGAGDLSYRVVRELDDPGIVAHGVALKPGKPLCLAASRGKPVVVLPGFPTSAIFTFHEFVAPVLRRLAGRPPQSPNDVPARLAVKVNSQIGRTEYLLVGLVPLDHAPVAQPQPQGMSQPHEPQPAVSATVAGPLAPDGIQLAAYPMGQGSGSVTTFSRADGFVTIGRHDELVEAGSIVSVRLLGHPLHVADLVVIGSHCVGLDYLLGLLQEDGFQTKFLAVGSTAGLSAARRGECDLAGVHLLDATTGQYNRPFLTPGLELISGYARTQGVVFRLGDPRFTGRTAREAVLAVRQQPGCLMVNRNQGSGTRILIDQLLEGIQPDGYGLQPRNHNAVAAAVAQSRADWGLAIRSVAEAQGLGFLPLAKEQYDFAIPRNRLRRPAVLRLRQLLADEQVRQHLRALGFELEVGAGEALTLPSEKIKQQNS